MIKNADGLLGTANREGASWYEMPVEASKNDVTGPFLVKAQAGTQTSQKRQAARTSGSGIRVYNSLPLTSHNRAVGGGARAEDEGAAYTVTGPPTLVGSYRNCFVYVLHLVAGADNCETILAYDSMKVSAQTADP